MSGLLNNPEEGAENMRRTVLAVLIVFGIFFGVLVGNYSSIFIGSGIAVDLVARLERKKLKEAKYATA